MTLQTIRISEPASIPRAAFFYESDIDQEQAVHGHTFVDDDFLNYQTNAFDVSRFAKLTLLGTDGIIIYDGAVVPDTLTHIMHWSPDSVTLSYKSKTSVKLRGPGAVSVALSTGPCFIGFTASWRNYAHWMQETLPKLVTYMRLRERFQDLKIVLPQFEQGSFQAQTINLLGIDHALVETIGHQEFVELRDVWLATNADIWSVPPLVTDAAAALVGAAKTFPNDQSSFCRRLYLHRAGEVRKVANFEAVKHLVESYGFGIVDFENMPLQSQVMAMQAADFIVGEHGAGLANLLFCKRGSSVLELFNPACVQPEFWSVSSVAKLNFGYLIGNHVVSPDEARATWNSAYEVPLDLLETAIIAMPGMSKPKTKAVTMTCERDSRPTIEFTAPDLFEIGKSKFALATANPATTSERTLVYKDRAFIEAYGETFSTISATKAFEFGEYKGGSAIFLTILLGLEKFVCVDSSEPVEDLANVLARNNLAERIRPYFKTPQDNADRIRDILQSEFGDEPPDLIIDDASHQYSETKQSFQIAFPYLKEGGYYIVEDWSWAHWSENQNRDHAWNSLPAMTNLILELVMLLPSSDLVEWITVKQGYVVVKKKASRHKAALLNISDTLRLRGRQFAQI